MKTLTITHEFDELSLCSFRDHAGTLHKPYIFASGRAHIEYSRTYEEWEIGAIEIDQGGSTSMRLDEKSPLYPLVVKALEDLQSDQIWEAIAEDFQSGEAEAAEYRAEMRRDDAMMERV